MIQFPGKGGGATSKAVRSGRVCPLPARASPQFPDSFKIFSVTPCIGIVAAAANEAKNRHHRSCQRIIHAPKVDKVEAAVLIAVPPCEKKIGAFAGLTRIVFGAFDQQRDCTPFLICWKHRFYLCAERAGDALLCIHNSYSLADSCLAESRKCRGFQPAGLKPRRVGKNASSVRLAFARAVRGRADAYGAVFRPHGESPRRNLVSRKVAVGSVGEDGAALCGCQQSIGNMLQPYSGAVKGWAINLSEVIWRSLAHLNPRLVGRCRSTRPTGCGASKGFRLLPSWPLRSRQVWRSGSWHAFAC